MSKPIVLFTPVSNGEAVESMVRKAARLAERVFPEVVLKERACAIKQHFGEGKNTGYLKPIFTRAIADYVKARGGLPFATDTNTLYRGGRSNALAHLETARLHGFTHEALGAPVIIADGLQGADQVAVPVTNTKHFREVRLASAMHQAASAIVLTHVKGHCAMGFGGSIKNVGMGCAARAGKLAMHQGGQPQFRESKCMGCGTCVRWCPADAIELVKTGGKPKARLTPEKCIGCGECLALCPFDAVGFSWSTEGPELAEKVCEHALGFVAGKPGHVGYLNFIIDVSKNCDCMGDRQKIEHPNLGILAGTNIVAVDKASADLTIKAYGEDIWQRWWPETQYAAQFRYGEAIGLGRTEYELVEAS